MPSKQLIFLRHGLAQDRENWEGPDEERPLTEEGRQKLELISRGIRRALPDPLEAVLSSPLTRARETAEIVQMAFPELSVEIEETLVPGVPLADFLKKIRRRKEKAILAVGHEPCLSEWILSLLGTRPKGSVRMKKGGCSLLELDLVSIPPKAEMIFLLPPKILRRLGA